MNRIRVGAVIVAAATALTLAGCGSGGGSGGGGGNQPYIAIVSKGFQQQFWQAVKTGADQEAVKEGAKITFVGPPTESDVEQQINMLTTALGKSPSALGFAALDSKAAAPLLAQAKANNIPVTTAATDNTAAAGEAAKHMSELLGGKGKVAMVVHDQTSKSGTDRRDGFLEWMKTNAPGITVLAPQYGGGDQIKSADITKSIIASNPDVAGIYGSNEGSATGVIKGVEESGKKDIKIVGFDSGKAQIDAIKNGVMAGAITQDPIDIGQQVVKAAMQAIKGASLPKVINTGYYWYDKSNINDPKIQALLYQ